MIHPRDALYGAERPFPALAGCEHYAGTENLMPKAVALQAEKGPCFDVTLDLEDGAPRGREKAHAELAVDVLRLPANRANRVGIRIHDPRSAAWSRDVEIVVRGAGDRVAYITVPKVATAHDVAMVVETVDRTVRDAGLRREIPLHVLIEGHAGLAHAFEIAAHPRVEVLDFGLMDFVSEHHGAIPDEAMRSPLQFTHPLVVRAKTRVAAAALAGGAVPSHNVSLDLKNAAQTRSDALRAKEEFGFLRMWSVHPSQIDPIVEAMRPDHARAEKAAAILAKAQAADWGPIEHEGSLHDRASYRYHWETLSRAERSGAPIPEEARRLFFTPARR